MPLVPLEKSFRCALDATENGRQRGFHGIVPTVVIGGFEE